MNKDTIKQALEAAEEFFTAIDDAFGASIKVSSGHPMIVKLRTAFSALSAEQQGEAQPKLPAQDKQDTAGWAGAAEWLRNNYQAHANIADLCDAMITAGSQDKQDAARYRHITEVLGMRFKPSGNRALQTIDETNAHLDACIAAMQAQGAKG